MNLNIEKIVVIQTRNTKKTRVFSFGVVGSRNFRHSNDQLLARQVERGCGISLYCPVNVLPSVYTLISKSKSFFLNLPIFTKGTLIFCEICHEGSSNKLSRHLHSFRRLSRIKNLASEKEVKGPKIKLFVMKQLIQIPKKRKREKSGLRKRPQFW